MFYRFTRVFILFMLVANLSHFGCQADETFRGTELPELPFVDIKLTDQNGNGFTLSEHKDDVTLMFFGFTYCPDVCPLTLSTWKKVASSLGEKAENVNFLYITVDPERDTPEQLKSHLANFSDKIIGLSGTEENLRSVYSGFGVYRERVEIAESAAGYLMNHTASMFLLDKTGVWRLKHSNDALPEDIVHDIKLLLQSRLPDIP